jgi:hypothetical protein
MQTIVYDTPRGRTAPYNFGMTILANPSGWNTNVITASLHTTVNPDAPVELPHLTSEPMLGLAEAAVLYAAGHAEPARLCLEDACEKHPQDPRIWLLLLDLHRLQDRREAFDAVHERYRAACPDGAKAVWASRPPIGAPTRLELSGRLSGEEQLRPMFDYARGHKLVAIDLDGVSRIDFEVAPKLCAALRLFALQSKRVILMHVSPLHAQLLAAIGLHPDVTVLPRPCSAEELEMPQERMLEAA